MYLQCTLSREIRTIFRYVILIIYVSSDPVSGPSPGVRNSFECDESDDDLRREEGINFAGDSGPLGASGRSISLDPGALGKKLDILDRLY